MRAHCTGPASTEALGREIAALVRPGDIILLSGPLGAGKTVFVKGLAGGMGVELPVTSPTYVFVHEHGGPVPLRHLDLYRIERMQEVLDLGIEEVFSDKAVTAIEWGEVAAPIAPGSRLEVGIEFGEEADAREVLLRPIGQDWSARRGGLLSAAEAVAP